MSEAKKVLPKLEFELKMNLFRIFEKLTLEEFWETTSILQEFRYGEPASLFLLTRFVIRKFFIY